MSLIFIILLSILSLLNCSRVVVEDGDDETERMDTSVDEISCPNGYFLDEENKHQKCQVGFYCIDCQSFICEEGHYCGEVGLSSPQPCPQGYFCDAIGLVEPKKCLSGFYCPFEKMIQPIRCDDGFYTLKGSIKQIPCPKGSTCNEGLKNECVEGFYCPTEGMIFEESKICDVGYHCPIKGLISPEACPESFYCPDTGLINVDYYICPEGHYCDLGSFEPKICPSGFYCPKEGLSEPIICQSGSRCPEPGLLVPIACETPGSHCKDEGMVETEQCPIGFSCPKGDFPVPSGQGFYIPQIGMIDPWECIAGYYCPLKVNSEMSICPIGFYCPFEKMIQPYLCPAKHYCDIEGMDEHGPKCEPRQSCPQGTSVPRLCPKGSYCDDSIPYYCPLGYYCPNEGMIESDIIQCEPGYFCGPHYGQYSPTICPVGRVCPKPMMSNSDPCPAGQYCHEVGNSKGTGLPCPALYFCPAGSSQPLSCPSGSYSDEEGLEVCKDCPVGSYCEDGKIFECFDALPVFIRKILTKNDRVSEYAKKLICPFEGMGLVMIYSIFSTEVFVLFIVPLCLVFGCIRRMCFKKSKKGEFSGKKFFKKGMKEEEDGYARNKLRYEQHSSDDKEEDDLDPNEKELLVDDGNTKDEKDEEDDLRYPEPIDFETKYVGYLLDNGEKKKLTIEMKIENQEKRLRGGGTDDNLRYIVKGQILEGEKGNYEHRNSGSIWYVFKKEYEDETEIEFEAPQIIIPSGEFVPREIVGTYERKRPIMVGNFRVKLVSAKKVY